jgi:hypothetical protein
VSGRISDYDENYQSLEGIVAEGTLELGDEEAPEPT